MSDEHDEQAWICRSQNGDPAAFEVLITRHQRMIHALTFRMTGSLADAEDLAQETFIQGFRQIAGYRGEALFSSWLYRIGLNLCINWTKREARRRQIVEQHLQYEEPGKEPDGHQSQIVQAALLKLHPKQRAAVVLTIFDGMNHAEAAEVLGCSETTVSWRLFAARKKLKKLLKDALSGRNHDEQR